MDLDALIAKMEADLAALKRARELAREYGGRDPNRDGAPEVSSAGQAASVPDEAAWYTHVPAILADGRGLTAREIAKEVSERHGRATAFPTIYAWLQRAIKRGDCRYNKKTKRYRLGTEGQPRSEKEAE